MVPNDPAITVKKSFLYEEFSNHPIKYITWNKKYGKIISDFIDNTDNVGIRQLIIQQGFEEAVKIMMDEIKRQEELANAA